MKSLIVFAMLISGSVSAQDSVSQCLQMLNSCLSCCSSTNGNQCQATCHSKFSCNPPVPNDNVAVAFGETGPFNYAGMDYFMVEVYVKNPHAGGGYIRSWASLKSLNPRFFQQGRVPAKEQGFRDFQVITRQSDTVYQIYTVRVPIYL